MRRHIELFAGCGGMALGMESAGFKLYFANEISPMASETFAHNIFNEDLRALSKENAIPEHTKWIKSNFDLNALRNRLSENPFNIGNSDISDLDNLNNLSNKLLVGDIDSLKDWLNSKPKIKKHFRDLDVDLLSGGPPCQGFSMAGLRVKDDYKNQLPWSFAEMADIIKPKVVLLENVEGITKAFEKNGQSYTAWIEVCKAFCLIGYVPVCMLLNSKYFGVPQNRPRFIMLGFRKDIFDSIEIENRNLLKKAVLEESKRFFNHVKRNKNNLDKIEQGSFDYYDIEKWKGLYDGDIFPKIKTDYKKFVSTKEAIGSLEFHSENDNRNSEYTEKLNRTFKKPKGIDDRNIYNHEPRNHSEKVKNRFHYYQIVDKLQNGVKASAVKLINGKELTHEMKIKTLSELIKHEFRIANGQIKGLNDIEELENYINEHRSSKHSQRAISAKEPAPAQLTIPDDICHYSETRTLTVREMARFQSFPDWFQFKSKVTTGGNQRKYEVPQYTQVGNAVPPLLAKAVGESVRILLNKIDKK